ncbi:hypothetical protein GB937_009252 [Aspergillus fischeri]|nr:hypothetical protein GB937_009252 [Aspergillus fischeri]
MRHIASEASFQLPFGLQMVTATALGLGIYFFPYSPRWLALVNYPDDCLRSIMKLRGLPSNNNRAKRHLGATRLKLEFLSCLNIFSYKSWKWTAVGASISFFQCLTSLLSNPLFYQMIAAIVCFLIIDKVGRRPLAIFGGFACAAAYTVIAVLSGLYSAD